MGVDECNHAADARDADPDREEFRPARHHQADRVALAQVLRQRPARVAVGARRKLAVAEALAVGQQRRRVAVLVRELQDDLREHARRIPGDRRGHLEGAQRTPRLATSAVSRSITPMLIPGERFAHAAHSCSTWRRDSARPPASGTGRSVARRQKRPRMRRCIGCQRSTPPNGTSGLSSSAARSG